MKKSIVFTAFLCLGLGFAFSAAEKSPARRFSPEAQRNFTIIDYPHDYNLNPQTANFSNEAQLFTGLYEGLFSYDPYSLEPVPALAQSFRISRDKKTWTFTLREDAVFSNGDKITAQTLRDSWTALLAPEMDAPFASLLDCITGAEAYRKGEGTKDGLGIFVRDETTLVVTLTTPTEHLNRILCHHAFSAVHPTEPLSVFSGPYVLKEYARKEITPESGDGPERIVLEKNPKYYDADNVALPTITLLFSEDLADNAYQINVGKADWACSANADRLLDKYSVKVCPEFATEYFFFKADRFPWNNADFRLALLAAVPWDKLRSQAFERAKTFIYPLNGYKSPEGFSDSDITEAKALLAAAKRRAKMKESDPVKIVIAVSSGEYMKAQAEALVEGWEKIGITVEVQTTPPGRYMQSIESWQADLFTYTWIGDFADPVAFLELFRGDSSLNVTAWKNRDFDGLLQKASECTDSAERLSILSQAEGVLLNSGAVLPVSHPISVNVIDTAAVGGWYMNALDIHPYKYLYFTGKTVTIPNIVRAAGHGGQL
ncbi:MAG: peptide ABC transporter substrate-binding protein [Spirochaetaceae bacterium]|jgi:oligopeptide transport system substrate-binding protein|nr:peptide ABC transporter substrate-binding protein [Spirochaetaceae bacterium]